MQKEFQYELYLPFIVTAVHSTEAREMHNFTSAGNIPSGFVVKAEERLVGIAVQLEILYPLSA